MEMKVCLVAAGFFLLLGAVTAQNKGKITVPASGKVVSGSEIKLTCTLDDGNAVPTSGDVDWKKGNTAVTGTATITLIDTQKHVLMIVKAVAGDAGSYTCRPDAKTVSDPQAVVVEAPKTPKLTCTSTTPIKVGVTTKCTCASTNDVAIVPKSYEFKVAGTAKPAEGTNTPKDELTVTGAGTFALNGKEVTCQVKFNAEPEGLSPAAAVKLMIIANQPKLECFPHIAPVGRVIKCTCTIPASSSHTHEYKFKVDGTIKTAEGSNTPQNELSVTGTMALDNKDISCEVEYKDFGDTSAVATVKLAVFSTCTCSAAPTKLAGLHVSLMTIGCVLLLSTLLMKE